MSKIENIGCLLCSQGCFMQPPVEHPKKQKVNCKVFGSVDERRNCPEFKTEPMRTIVI